MRCREIKANTNTAVTVAVRPITLMKENLYSTLSLRFYDLLNSPQLAWLPRSNEKWVSRRIGIIDFFISTDRSVTGLSATKCVGGVHYCWIFYHCERDKQMLGDFVSLNKGQSAFHLLPAGGITRHEKQSAEIENSINLAVRRRRYIKSTDVREIIHCDSWLERNEAEKQMV